MYETLKEYIPVNEQETIDKQSMIQFVERNPDALLRTNLYGHITSSAIVVNETMDKVLFAHHNIYDSWGWVGGHNDGDPDCLNVALKEAKEETGVTNIRPYNEDILGVDIIYVNNHIKHGEYVSDHIHFNVTYLFIASEDDQLKIAQGENSDVAWFDMNDVVSHISEPRMVPVYEKLFQQVQKIKNSSD